MKKMFRACQGMSDLHVYQLNYGVEHLGLGMVIWYKQKVTQLARVPRTYTWYVAGKKEVPDRNIDRRTFGT
jgi:hypothetical protein